ncbi:SMC-Scp complex subunit ScpB [Modestobacter sp. I12A-02628]|uniref:SMC-Scp complex subunit ScpB n=1 Tax=Goekera deserti TaxID=2497753 RepID=A0A7K3WEI9_9ACTN|nr:SMC-Scp complex subunit ScpB [Goekera deserti]NDI46251.1 SMC-Scp complex subunit ScpB [Goekera deserti]NEL54817.1 SMC-Scp complex subunit ScpB [Goekera deserti]
MSGPEPRPGPETAPGRGPEQGSGAASAPRPLDAAAGGPAAPGRGLGVDLALFDDTDDDADAEETPAGQARAPQPAAGVPGGQPLDTGLLRGRLEAVLFVVDQPVDEETLAAAVESTVADVRDALVELAAEHERRRGGVTLRRVGEGWRLYTRDEHAPVVERYLLGGQRNRLTQAALETLAVIAYQQPVTRARVSAVRGVGVDGVMRSLVSRGLVREVGTDPDTGGHLYGTTALFLERLGLRSLEELPALAPLLPDTASVLEERPRARSAGG